MPEAILIRKLKAGRIQAQIDNSSFNDETNEVSVVFATEALVLEEMPDGERFYEQMEISERAGNLERINNNGPVLDSHDDTTIKKQLGVVVRAWIDAATKEAKAIIRLSKSDEWKSTVQDIKDGIVKNISCRFRRLKMVDTGQEKDGKRILRTIQWEAQEISFVTIPADYKSGVRSEQQEYEVQITKVQKKNTMTEQEKQARKEAIATVVRKLRLPESFATELIDDEAITVDVARAKAIDKAEELVIQKQQQEPSKPVDIAALQGKERQRALDIIGVCRKLNLAEAKDDKGVLFSEELIGKDITVDVARALAIDKAAEIDAMNKPSGQQSAVKTTDRDAKRALAKEHAIFQRAGIVMMDDNNKPVKYDPDVYRGLSLKEIAFESLVERGINPRSLSDKELKQACLDPNYAIRSGAQMSTSDFPSITENVLNKVALQRYQLAERTWEPLVKKRSVKDFKPVSNVRLNDVIIDSTSQILEGGEYTMLKLTDGKEAYSIKKYGKKFVLSWEALINDDLSMFNDTPALVVDGFTQFQNKLFYELLSTNTALSSGANKMADGKTFFHTDHANLIATGTTISLDSLGLARKTLRKQTAPNGSLLNLTPKYLVVGPDLEQLAEQYTSANYVATEQGKINKLGTSLTPIVDANITDGRWFLFATPGQLPGIEVANLEGQEMYTESRYSFDVDGMEVKFRMTHGIKVIDYRCAIKNPGA